jgi:branched-subunit amino acid ABC-type transport system permease component
MSAHANILLGGVFHAAVLFLVAAGLQLVLGVQKILNLACGSFYALGAYFGITFIGYAAALQLQTYPLTLLNAKDFSVSLVTANSSKSVLPSLADTRNLPGSREGEE